VRLQVGLFDDSPAHSRVNDYRPLLLLSRVLGGVTWLVHVLLTVVFL
jgi:hypothetical protein